MLCTVMTRSQCCPKRFGLIKKVNYEYNFKQNSWTFITIPEVQSNLYLKNKTKLTLTDGTDFHRYTLILLPGSSNILSKMQSLICVNLCNL